MAKNKKPSVEGSILCEFCPLPTRQMLQEKEIVHVSMLKKFP